MAEFYAIPLQTVASGENALFDGKGGCGCIVHRNNSGVFILKPHTGKYRITFHANIGGATADVPTSIAIALNGEPVGTATMIVTPSVAGALNNVSAMLTLTAPCCMTITVINTTNAPITLENANLTIECV